MRGEKIVSESNIKQQASDGRADFDFFMGSWTIQNRILRERLKGSTSWEEFGGTSVARKILGGLGHLEEFTMDRASGATEGVAVRLFDPKTQQWSVSAADNRNGFDPRPAIGAFKDGLYWLLRSSVQKRASKRALAVPVLCNLLTRQVVIWFLHACSLPGFWNRYTK